MNTYDDNFEIPAPDENVVCFYHEYEENGCFSNWYRAEFEYAGKRFTFSQLCCIRKYGKRNCLPF